MPIVYFIAGGICALCGVWVGFVVTRTKETGASPQVLRTYDGATLDAGFYPEGEALDE